MFSHDIGGKGVLGAVVCCEVVVGRNVVGCRVVCCFVVRFSVVVVCLVLATVVAVVVGPLVVGWVAFDLGQPISSELSEHSRSLSQTKYIEIHWHVL